MIDLLLNWRELEATTLRVVRLRSDGFDPRALMPGVSNPTEAVRGFVARLLTQSGAEAVPSRDLLFGELVLLSEGERSRVLDAPLDQAEAGAALAAAAFERQTALVANRRPQQVGALRRFDDARIVGQKGDANRRRVGFVVHCANYFLMSASTITTRPCSA